MLDGSYAHVGQPRNCLLHLLCSGDGGDEELLFHGLLDALIDEKGSPTVPKLLDQGGKLGEPNYYQSCFITATVLCTCT